MKKWIIFFASLSIFFMLVTALSWSDELMFYLARDLRALGLNFNFYEAGDLLFCFGLGGEIFSVVALLVLWMLYPIEEDSDVDKQKAINEAMAIAGKTWSIVSTGLSRDDEGWYIIICMVDLAGGREIINASEDHNMAKTYLFIRENDKVTFAFTDRDQAENDAFESTSFLIPTVLSKTVEAETPK